MEDPKDPKSNIVKSTNFVLRAAQNAALNKTNDLTALKRDAVRHLQLAGIFYNEISHTNNREMVAAAVKPELDKYRKLVDVHTKTGINNFVKSVPRVPVNFDILETKTGLLDATVFLANFRKQKCQGDYEHCKNLEPTDNDVKELQIAYKKRIKDEYKESDEMVTDEEDVNFEAKDIGADSELNADEIKQLMEVDDGIDLKSSTQNVFSDKMKNSDQEEYRKINTPIFQPKIPSMRTDSRAFAMQHVPIFIDPHQNKRKADPTVLLDLNEEVFGKKKTLPKNIDTNNENERVCFPNQQIPETPVDVPRKNDFKSATLELKFQNQTIYNKISNESAKGTRSLGLNRNAVRAKFVSHCEKSEDKKNIPSKLDPELLSHDRLKNIDPKMVELIMNEIMESGSIVKWNDIAGLEYAKKVIYEAIILPIVRPDIFRGLRKPAKGLLLFGPPGTGKTMIGKCIASQSKSTFFNISASALTSKWIGEGEKMVRALFAVAAIYQPSVIFIDEIDSLLCQRSESEHESTRRLKTEFLVQLDGAGTGEEDKIIIVGATNRPQELDEAARRRLEKRLYIPLPEFQARRQIMYNLLAKERNSLSDQEIEKIAKLAEGFSGADMKGLCQEAAMHPVREIDTNDISDISLDEVRPISFNDFKLALSTCRPSVSQDDLGSYIKWDQTFGSSVKT